MFRLRISNSKVHNNCKQHTFRNCIFLNVRCVYFRTTSPRFIYVSRLDTNYISWRIEDQLDVTCYFILHFMCSTCFGHQYIHHQELATILLNYHIGRIVLGSMCVWACNTDTTPTQPHWNSNTHRTKNNTTNVVIRQNSRKLLMMDIIMSETCWAHKKWNKIASDNKMVFYSSTITMMHGPINIRSTSCIV